MFAELEKIINDGKSKFKAYEQADAALQQVKSLDQYEKETRKALDDGLKKLEDLKANIKGWEAKELAAKGAAEEVEAEAKNKAKKIIDEANNHAQQVLAKAVLEGDKRKRELAEEIKQSEAKLVELQAKAEEWKLKAEAAKTAHDTYMSALGK